MSELDGASRPGAERLKAWIAEMRAAGRCETCGAEEAHNGRCADCRKAHAAEQEARRRRNGVQPRGYPQRCRACGEIGHNRRTCGAP